MWISMVPGLCNLEGDVRVLSRPTTQRIPFRGETFVNQRLPRAVE